MSATTASSATWWRIRPPVDRTRRTQTITATGPVAASGRSESPAELGFMPTPVTARIS